MKPTTSDPFFFLSSFLSFHICVFTYFFFFFSNTDLQSKWLHLLWGIGIHREHLNSAFYFTFFGLPTKYLSPLFISLPICKNSVSTFIPHPFPPPFPHPSSSLLRAPIPPPLDRGLLTSCYSFFCSGRCITVIHESPGLQQHSSQWLNLGISPLPINRRVDEEMGYLHTVE